jgi:hypothetical protein
MISTVIVISKVIAVIRIIIINNNFTDSFNHRSTKVSNFWITI